MIYEWKALACLGIERGSSKWRSPRPFHLLKLKSKLKKVADLSVKGLEASFPISNLITLYKSFMKHNNWVILILIYFTFVLYFQLAKRATRASDNCKLVISQQTFFSCRGFYEFSDIVFTLLIKASERCAARPHNPSEIIKRKQQKFTSEAAKIFQG